MRWYCAVDVIDASSAVRHEELHAGDAARPRGAQPDGTVAEWRGEAEYGGQFAVFSQVWRGEPFFWGLFGRLPFQHSTDLNSSFLLSQPVWIPKDSHDITALAKNIGICTERGIHVVDPTK